MFYKTSEPHGLPHNPFNAIVVPRPIGWISTYDADGNANLGPYSFFNGISYTPPQVLFSAGPRPVPEDHPAGLKDSCANAEATGCFVVNIVSYDLREAMNKSSIEAPPDVDEFEFAGVTKEPATMVNAPRVKEAKIHLECELFQIVPLKRMPGYEPNRLVIGEVVGIHIDESVLTDGLVDVAKLRPIARLGYRGDYAVIDETFEMLRPQWP